MKDNWITNGRMTNESPCHKVNGENMQMYNNIDTDESFFFAKTDAAVHMEA